MTGIIIGNITARPKTRVMMIPPSRTDPQQTTPIPHPATKQ
jgi:hypothetical protein